MPIPSVLSGVLLSCATCGLWRNQTERSPSCASNLLPAQVVVPATFMQFTRRRVLTSSWIDGEKLSQSRAGDVATLVNVGVVCYLKQLLDTGLFMCAPLLGGPCTSTSDALLCALHLSA